MASETQPETLASDHQPSLDHEPIEKKETETSKKEEIPHPADDGGKDETVSSKADSSSAVRELGKSPDEVGKVDAPKPPIEVEAASESEASSSLIQAAESTEGQVEGRAVAEEVEKVADEGTKATEAVGDGSKQESPSNQAVETVEGEKKPVAEAVENLIEKAESTEAIEISAPEEKPATAEMVEPLSEEKPEPIEAVENVLEEKPATEAVKIVQQDEPEASEAAENVPKEEPSTETIESVAEEKPAAFVDKPKEVEDLIKEKPLSTETVEDVREKKPEAVEAVEHVAEEKPEVEAVESKVEKESARESIISEPEEKAAVKTVEHVIEEKHEVEAVESKVEEEPAKKSITSEPEDKTAVESVEQVTEEKPKVEAVESKVEEEPAKESITGEPEEKTAVESVENVTEQKQEVEVVEKKIEEEPTKESIIREIEERPAVENVVEEKPEVEAVESKLEEEPAKESILTQPEAKPAVESIENVPEEKVEAKAVESKIGEEPAKESITTDPEVKAVVGSVEEISQVEGKLVETIEVFKAAEPKSEEQPELEERAEATKVVETLNVGQEHPAGENIVPQAFVKIEEAKNGKIEGESLVKNEKSEETIQVETIKPQDVSVSNDAAEVAKESVEGENGFRDLEVVKEKETVPTSVEVNNGKKVEEKVNEPVGETKDSELRVKEEESAKVDADNLECTKEVASEEPPKDNNDTITNRDLPARVVSVKPSTKSSGNIMSKVKQSIVKVRKAIVGKSPSSGKGDQKVK